jgi:hypothetical protein
VSDWPDELEADSITVNGAMHRRLVAVHASMDDWERDFLAALKRVAPLCDCHVESGEGAWRETHDPECVSHRWKEC